MDRLSQGDRSEITISITAFFSRPAVGAVFAAAACVILLCQNPLPLLE
jgi:hypothetical protein